jgi:hypothetical protein
MKGLVDHGPGQRSDAATTHALKVVLAAPVAGEPEAHKEALVGVG